MSPRVEPSRAAIYCRISLDRRGEGYGVERQERACRELAAQRGWTVGEVYIDNDISAHSGKPRPEWERLLSDIAAGRVDGLIAWHLDRILRRVIELERVVTVLEASPIKNLQVAFVKSVDVDLTTASGRMMARILATVAAHESEQKGERVRAARQQEAEAGKAHGRLGYGFREDRTIHPEEAKIVKEIAARVVSGETLYSIATDLNARGVPTPGSDRWVQRSVTKAASLDGTPRPVRDLIAALRSPEPVSPTSLARIVRSAGGHTTAEAVREDVRLLAATESKVTDSEIAWVLNTLQVPPPPMQWRTSNLRDMIRRGALAGWREYGPGGRGGHGELKAEGEWEPILTKETLDEIRKITDSKTGAPVKGGRKPKHLLSTIARCGGCGAPMGGHTDKRTGVARYQCAQQPGLEERCGKMSVVAAPVDAMVTATILDALADSDFRAQRTGTRTGPVPSDVARAEAELEQVRADRATYAQEAGDGLMTAQEWRIVREGLDARAKRAQAVLGRYSPQRQAALRDIPARRAEIEKWWTAATLERQREVVSALIEYVTINPVRKGGNRFDPERVQPPKWRV